MQEWGATRNDTQKMQLGNDLLLEAWEHTQKLQPKV